MGNMNLSKRQLEVCGLILEGLSNQEIADRLFICLKTVKFHLQYIYWKKNVTNRNALMSLLVKEERAREHSRPDNPISN